MINWILSVLNKTNGGLVYFLDRKYLFNSVKVVDVLIWLEFSSSKRDSRQLISQNSIKINGKSIIDVNQCINESLITTDDLNFYFIDVRKGKQYIAWIVIDKYENFNNVKRIVNTEDIDLLDTGAINLSKEDLDGICSRGVAPNRDEHSIIDCIFELYENSKP